jgi:NTP pyrophosphatase (non-canonical NTP hydrolase)
MGNGMNVEKLKETLNKSRTGYNSVGPLFGVGWTAAIDYVLTLLKEYKQESFLKQLKRLNEERCPYFGNKVEEWSETDWGCAIGGESGELQNWLIKRRRGDNVDLKEVAHEMADIVIYVDMLATKMNIDLEETIKEKWNIVSERRNIPLKME